MTRIVAAGLWFSLACCARRGTVSPAADSSSQPPVAPAAITLERTACFGGCPVYTVAVLPSGEVKYEGKAHVRWLGAATDRIPKERVDSLLSELEQAGYFSFADGYTAADPTCGRYATDSPSVTTSATLRGRTKRIAHDYGCSAAPGALAVLEHRIDEALNSGQWTGR